MSKRTRPLVATFFALSALPVCAHAETITLDSRLEAATVFTNGASLRRSARAPLPAGEHQVIFPGLPPNLLDDSVRISGLGPATVVESVTIRAATISEVPTSEYRQLSTQLEEARREHAGLQRQRADAQRQRAGVTAPLDAQIAAASARIETLAHRVQTLGAQPTKAVIVDVTAGREGQLNLALEYMVPGAASWSPAYAAHFDPSNGRVALDTYASVRQTTGEDWTNVRLSVSTTTPDRGLALPRMSELALELEPEPERDPESERANRIAEINVRLQARLAAVASSGADMAMPHAMPGRPAAAPRLAVEAPPPPPPPAPVEVRTGVAREGLLSARIELPNPVNLRSGVAPRRILAAHQETTGTIEHQAAPRQSDSVFLATRFRNTARFPLLAGPVGLFVRDEYVGSTQMNNVPIDESLLLPFGVDPSITVERTRGARQMALRNGRDDTTLRFQYRLVNHREQNVRVTVLEQLPVTHSQGLTVRVLPGGPERRENTDGDAPGVLRWNMDLAAGGTTRWELAYVVSAPHRRGIVGEL